MMNDRLQVLIEKKHRGEKMSMLTAYSYPFAALAAQAGIDMILVGDSLANVELGRETTNEVGMPEMLHHTKAVRAGAPNACVIADMPFGSFHEDAASTLSNAQQLLSAGADAVKIEWHSGVAASITSLKSHAIPFMGHVGLTPQTAEELGGFKVQGKTPERAAEIIRQAQIFEKAGAFAVVIECVPEGLGKEITEALTRSFTVGIGAGRHTDAQVLVSYDMLGLFDKYRPKFVKQYADIASPVRDAFVRFKQDVAAGDFPAQEHVF
jgi:3-methyl-2-oxobutanoate hydroxymethyltransferase